MPSTSQNATSGRLAESSLQTRSHRPGRSARAIGPRMPNVIVTMDASMRVDLHQHVWSAPLIEALAARDRLPRIERSGGRLIVHCAGEAPYEIDVDAQTSARRAAALDADGLDLAVIAVSSP